MVKPDVVLVALETVAGDSGALPAGTWDLLLLDERNRGRSGLARAHAALANVPARARAILAQGNPIAVLPAAHPLSHTSHHHRPPACSQALSVVLCGMLAVLSCAALATNWPDMPGLPLVIAYDSQRNELVCFKLLLVCPELHAENAFVRVYNS